MKRILVLVGLLAIAVVPVLAQHQALKANIPFEFMVGSKMLPAGSYEFTVDQGRNVVTLRNMDTGKSMVTSIVTLLAADPGFQGNVTFDTVGEKKALEAVYVAGTGFLLHATKGKHNHEIVKAAEKD